MLQKRLTTTQTKHIMEYLLIRKTRKKTNFCHDAYNDYVEYRLDKIANEFNIPLQYNSKKHRI